MQFVDGSSRVGIPHTVTRHVSSSRYSATPDDVTHSLLTFQSASFFNAVQEYWQAEKQTDGSHDQGENGG
jgi:hypothetical protein